MTHAQLDFWFDFASTYSYPASQRIQGLAAAQRTRVRFRPFMLGAIFKAQGWDTSPFNIYTAKGRYMWRDMARLCARMNLPLVHPDPFPQNSLLAARVTLAAGEAPWIGDYCAEVFRAEFGRGETISDPAVIRSLLARFTPAPDLILARADTPDIKQQLKDQTNEASVLGVFGSPTFVTQDEELFWGNDRLDDALAWTRSSIGPNVADLDQK